MRPILNFAAGLAFAGLGTASATAAPAMPPPGVIAGSAVETVVTDGHRHLRYSGRTDRAYRMHRRHNTHRHGNPNARNPHQHGHQQQLGNTTNGPRDGPYALRGPAPRAGPFARASPAASRRAELERAVGRTEPVAPGLGMERDRGGDQPRDSGTGA